MLFVIDEIADAGKDLRPFSLGRFELHRIQAEELQHVGAT